MKRITCIFLSLVMTCSLFIGCSSNTPTDSGSTKNHPDGTVDNSSADASQDGTVDPAADTDKAEPKRVETIYKLSDDIDLDAVEIEDDIAENPYDYDICLVVPGFVLGITTIDEIEEETNLEIDSKGNFYITTTTTKNHVVYTDTSGWEEFKNNFANSFNRIINELNRDDSLGFHITHNEDFSEFEITGSKKVIENLPEIYITSMMRLGAFYQAILGKSPNEMEVTVTVYYFS